MVATGLAFILVALVWGRKADDAFDRLAAAEIFLTGGALAAVGAAKWVIALSVWRSVPSSAATVSSPQPAPGTAAARRVVPPVNVKSPQTDPGSDIALTILVGRV